MQSITPVLAWGGKAEYCIAMYCTVLNALHWILFCTILHCFVLHQIAPHGRSIRTPPPLTEQVLAHRAAPMLLAPARVTGQLKVPPRFGGGGQWEGL